MHTCVPTRAQVRTLTKHAVEHAISLVDVMVPGLPLVFVNDAWERLTGYRVQGTGYRVQGAGCPGATDSVEREGLLSLSLIHISEPTRPY